MGWVGKKSDETLSKIQEVQSVLRNSIETAKNMAEQSDELVQRYKRQIDGEAKRA